MPTRPKNQDELQKREAIGIIRASRFIRNYARSHKPINFETICAIHREIFKNAWLEIAGKYRDEEIKITDSKHLPPHHSQVMEKINAAETKFGELLKNLESSKVEGLLFADKPTEEAIESIGQIIKVAAWVHHTITYVHPFREGNGRTARLAANLILERYGLVGISIKIEKENKNRYRQALAQIDDVGDYEPLENLIAEGLMERYEGAAVKYYEYKKDKDGKN